MGPLLQAHAFLTPGKITEDINSLIQVNAEEVVIDTTTFSRLESLEQGFFPKLRGSITTDLDDVESTIMIFEEVSFLSAENQEQEALGIDNDVLSTAQFDAEVETLLAASENARFTSADVALLLVKECDQLAAEEYERLVAANHQRVIAEEEARVAAEEKVCFAAVSQAVFNVQVHDRFQSSTQKALADAEVDVITMIKKEAAHIASLELVIPCNYGLLS